ncbi:hypothetical protein [Amycolatopsis sp. cg9]|uniref:hypothetical protein n=1 Tax=Amycolatopsis sp. cg9 TaxID=3238801 RepID=UPI003526B8FA
MVTELTDDRSRLDALSWDRDERAAIRSVFGRSCEKLPADEARLFRRLGTHVDPDFSPHAAAAVADCRSRALAGFCNAWRRSTFHHVARAEQGLGDHGAAIVLCRKAIAISRHLDMNLDLNVAVPPNTAGTSGPPRSEPG